MGNGVNPLLGLSVQVEPDDPNALPLVDNDCETVAVVDVILKEVRWWRR